MERLGSRGTKLQNRTIAERRQPRDLILYLWVRSTHSTAGADTPTTAVTRVAPSKEWEMVTGGRAQTLETNSFLLKRRGGDRRSTTPFARDFSHRLLRCHKLAPDTGQVAWTQAGRAGSGRKARTPRARPTRAEDRRSGAASFEVAAGPFPVPSQDTAEVDAGTAGTAGPCTTPPPGLDAGNHRPGKTSATRTHRPWSPSRRSGWPRPPRPRRYRSPW